MLLIETIDNAFQLLSLGILAVMTVYRAVTTRNRIWILLYMFYIVIALGNLYWFLYMMLYKETPFYSFIPDFCWIAAIMALSAFSSLLSLLGLFPPTSDLNVVGGWAILVFCLITFYKLKCGFGYYLKSFCEPVAFFAPINLVSELATPVAMSFRHYGNVLSGIVISVLVTAGLTGLSDLLLGWLPGVLGDIPFLRIGLPAILSVYFDLFSGCLQAFIFAMLTMLYVAGAFSPEAYQKKKDKAAARRALRRE